MRVRLKECLVLALTFGALAAVGLPALADLLDNPNQIGCVSNLKTLGVAFSMYADDHGRYLPDWGTILYDGPCWHAHLYEGKYIGDARPLVCPAEPDAVEALESGGTWGVFERDPGLEAPYVVTYSFWPDVSSAGASMYDQDFDREYSPVGRVSDERLVLLFDGTTCVTWDPATAQQAWQWRDPPEPIPYTASARHQGSVEDGEGTFNILWLDGHVTNVLERRVRDENNLNR